METLIKLYRKVPLQMKINLAIKIILLLFLTSCSSLKQEIKEDSYQIIQVELLRHSSLFENEKVYIDFTLNNYLKGFIRKNETDSIRVNYNLLKRIRPEQIQSIFNKKEVIHLVESLNNSNFKPSLVSLPENVIMDSEEEPTNANEFQKKKIRLSHPVITSDNIYALISYSFGNENAMQGGVNLYFKIKNGWKFYKSIDMWIE